MDAAVVTVRTESDIDDAVDQRQTGSLELVAALKVSVVPCRRAVPGTLLYYVRD